MNNLTNKLLAIKEISEQIFGGELETTYVISVWQDRITFSSHYNREVARLSMSMDGVTSVIDSMGFTTITFKYFDLKIEITLS